MNAPVTIRDVMTDPALFGGQFGGDSWSAWRALLAGFYGLPLAQPEQHTFQELTGRTAEHSTPHDELWLAIGRRGGKSQIAALLAVYEAAFQDYSAHLAPGEVATVMAIAADRRQARSVMRYISGLLHANPMLKRMVRREDREAIELTNRTVIEVHTASFRAVRGYSVACCIADEVAFWRSEESANPDHEIINAIRPAMATLSGKLVALSSPYARRGALWDAHRRYFGKPAPVLVAKAPSRTMNPTLPARVVEQAMERDAPSARAEYMAEFRTDVETFVSQEQVDACTRPGPLELAYMGRYRYVAFVDPSGGSKDGFTLAIGHVQTFAHRPDRFIVDVVRERRPPFSPEAVVCEFAALLWDYGIRKVEGDRYAGEWPREAFSRHHVRYEPSAKPKSDLYQDLLPQLNAEGIELPPEPRLATQLIDLERRTGRGGRDSIDHPPNGHDDLANAVAGLAATRVRKRKRAGVW